MEINAQTLAYVEEISIGVRRALDMLNDRANAEIPEEFYGDLEVTRWMRQAVCRKYLIAVANMILAPAEEFTSVPVEDGRLYPEALALADTIIGSKTEISEAARPIAIRHAVDLMMGTAEPPRYGWHNAL